MYGLDPDTLRNIQQVIKKITTIDTVILYGSRAKGNYHHGSDIDITLKGKTLTLSNSVYPLMDELEELYLPYTFDISIFEHIDNKHLIEHINRVGKLFYVNKKQQLLINKALTAIEQIKQNTQQNLRNTKQIFTEIATFKNTIRVTNNNEGQTTQPEHLSDDLKIQQTKKLAAIYQQKISHLEELKKSIQQQVR